MKFLMASVFTAAFSLTAGACPVYNGVYKCQGDGVEQTLNLKTSTVDGQTVYDVNGSSIIADGVSRKISFMGGMYDVTGFCQDATAHINILLDGGEGDNEACGTQKWNLLYSTAWTPDGKNITEFHSGSTLCADGKVVPEDMRGAMSCTRQ